MSDVGPRRSMDVMRPQPAQQPVQAPQRPAQSAQRPVRPVARPMQQAQPQPAPATRPMAYRPQPYPSAPAPAPQTPVRSNRPASKPAKSRRVFWVVLQFIIGLLVIAGVAAAIVMLYVRYYQ